jgi:hypothetical protein
MRAWQALVVPGLGRVSQPAENVKQKALFGIVRAGLAQVLAHFGFADVNLVGHR